MKKRVGEYRNKLELLEDKDEVDIEIGHRGGHYGLKAEKVLGFLGIDVGLDLLPDNVGVYCNYLGGGLRGAITGGGYSERIGVKEAKKLDDFISACKQRYEEIESEWAEDPEAFTDEWREAGTKSCRDTGIVSAY